MSITCELCGGLGNQLFMIFNTMNCSFENNKPFWFKNNKVFVSSTCRFPYWDTLFSNLKNFVLDNDYDNNIVCIEEKDMSYLHLLPQERSILLKGYFQSPLYFKKNFKKIYNFIGIDEKKEELKIKLNNFESKNLTSLHFRLGDYKKYQHFHPILSYDYYKKAIEKINEKTFLYFYEDEDQEYVENVIKQLKNDFPETEYISSKQFKLKDWEEILLMSLCSHHIIANSTFSWWGAFLNESNTKKVIYPEVWFVGQKVREDLFPEEWIKI
jgi:hypothetical protein